MPAGGGQTVLFANFALYSKLISIKLRNFSVIAQHLAIPYKYCETSLNIEPSSGSSILPLPSFYTLLTHHKDIIHNCLNSLILKRYVSPDEWPSWPSLSASNVSLFPPYCDGPAYLLSPRSASALLQAHRSLPPPRPFFWLEDVFVTGVLAGITRSPNSPVPPVRLREFLTSQTFGRQPPPGTTDAPVLVDVAHI